MTTWLQTKDTASYLQPDLFVKGNLLFSVNQALLTSDSKSQHLIVGQPKLNQLTKIPYIEGKGQTATFSKITAFAQVNRTYTLIADSFHGCIRSVDRLTNITQHVAGICKERVYSWETHTDGKLSEATFHVISTMEYHQGVIYVVENAKKTVRKVSMQEGEVTTIVAKDRFRKYDVPRRLLFDQFRKMIYITAFNGLSQFDLSTGSFSYLTQEYGNSSKGHLRTSEWSGASEIIFIDQDTLLVTDTFNGKLKAIDLKSMTVNTWCFQYAPSKTSCEYYRSPAAMTLMSCTVYLSIARGIQKLELPLWFCGKDKGKIPTSTTSTAKPTNALDHTARLTFRKTSPMNPW